VECVAGTYVCRFRAILEVDMSAKKISHLAIALGVALFTDVSGSPAAEYGFTTYPLGSLSFGAGFTPPPGAYVSEAVGSYSGKIGGNFDFGGRTFNAGIKADIFSDSFNVLYVPNTKVLDGYMGFSLTAPAAYVNYDAHASGPLASIAAQTEGTGLGDMTFQAQLGWNSGDFSHTAHLLVVAPTGRYDTGFYPIAGLNRPSLDVGWAFTWLDKTTQLEFNGAVGFMAGIENHATQYQTGDEFHFEWAIGKKFESGLQIGIVGYDYRQLTGDSGQGAPFPFVGQVDAIGPGLTYSTKIGDTPLTFGARNYEEYNTVHRFKGNLSIATVTAAF
jgi:hypothetical protein